MASKGVVKTPAEKENQDISYLTKEEHLLGQFAARQLAAFVQRVAEQAAATGKVPTIKDWLTKTNSISKDLWANFSKSGDPSGQKNTVSDFSKLFLAHLADRDVTSPELAEELEV